MSDIILNGHPITTGSSIAFNTENTYDNVRWSGEVIGVVGYEMAKLVTDVDNYYAEILKSNAAALPIIDQQFLVIEVTDGSLTSNKEAFAITHITETTVDLIAITDSWNIRIHNMPESSVANAIQVLAAAGIQATFVDKVVS